MDGNNLALVIPLYVEVFDDELWGDDRTVEQVKIRWRDAESFYRKSALHLDYEH